MDVKQFTIIFFLLTLLFICCADDKKDSVTGPENTEELVLSEKAKIISPSDWKKYLLYQTQLDSGLKKSSVSNGYSMRYVFDKAIQDYYSLEQGDILLAKIGEGICEKITRIPEKAEELWIETGFASLAEAIKQGRIQFSHKFTEGEGRNLKKGVELETEQGVMYTELIDVDLWRQGGAAVTANGSFSIVPEIKGDLLFSYHSLEELELDFILSQDLDLTVTSGFAELSYKPDDYFLGSIEFGTYPVPGAGIPLTITPEMELFIGVNFDLSSELTTGLKQTLIYEQTLAYKNTNWNAKSDTTLTIKMKECELTGNAQAMIYVKPQLNFKIYKSLAPHVSMSLFSELDADIQYTPWWQLYCGLSAGVGVSMDILDRNVLDYDPGIIEIYRRKIGESAEAFDNPVLKVTPSSIDCGSGPQSEAGIATLEIENTGTGRLTWTVTSDKEWIKIIKSSGEITTEKATVGVRVERSMLSAGSHSGTITVDSNGGQASIPVKVQVESSELEIILPNMTTAWVQGQQNVPIRWETGGLGGEVHLALLRASSFVETIIKNTENDGEYDNYDVPEKLPPGDEYKIYITSPSTGKHATSQTFQVKAKDEASITVTLPNEQTVWTKGEPAGQIQWTTTGDMHSYVRINLLRGFSAVDEIADNVPNNGSYQGYTVPANLATGAGYRVQVHTMDFQTVGYSEEFTIQDAGGSEPGTVTDIDGNVYKTVKIGDQWWLAENLKVTHYRNGDPIPSVTNNNDWENLSTGAYCVYDNDESYAETYGYLYNWYAVNDSRKIAPEGWHVPTDDEWKMLEIYLGMSPSEADEDYWRGSPVGSKLAGNASLWPDGDLIDNSAFGKSGFTALPAGFRDDYDGSFSSIGGSALFWSVTETNDKWSWSRHLVFHKSEVERDKDSKERGYSVRLVKD